jgi:hypothetical protein
MENKKRQAIACLLGYEIPTVLRGTQRFALCLYGVRWGGDGEAIQPEK